VHLAVSGFSVVAHRASGIIYRVSVQIQIAAPLESSMRIRHLATSWAGSVIAAGEFENTVHIWDLLAERCLTTLATVLDFGGTRLAIACDGKACIAAAYNSEGVAAYSIPNGAETWRRKDLKKAQTVRVSLDDRRVFACFDDRACQVLNRETGKTIKRWTGVRDVWESPYEPVTLLERHALILQSPENRKITSIARETFAALSVAFAPGLVCVSESGGPLRCLDIQTGEERWRFAEKNQHFLEVAYAEHSSAFVGVCWPYKFGGSFRLLRFQPRSGEVSAVTDLGKSGRFAFCQRGTRLLTSNGLVIDSATGRRELMLPFADSAST
jgi:hypothetical protein